jgi:hypothetical protein
VIPSNYVTSKAVAARFRLYDGMPSMPSYFGVAVGGEVEDYRWTFSPTAVTLTNLKARSTSADLTIPLILLALMSGVTVVLFWRRHHHT